MIRVHKTESHRIRLSPQVRFKLKTRENLIQKFFLGLNRGANKFVTPGVLQPTPLKRISSRDLKQEPEEGKHNYIS